MAEPRVISVNCTFYLGCPVNLENMASQMVGVTLQGGILKIENHECKVLVSREGVVGVIAPSVEHAQDVGQRVVELVSRFGYPVWLNNFCVQHTVGHYKLDFPLALEPHLGNCLKYTIRGEKRKDLTFLTSATTGVVIMNGGCGWDTLLNTFNAVMMPVLKKYKLT